MTRNLAIWIAKQFDGGITMAGAGIALLLTGVAIGAAICLVSDLPLVAGLLGVVFLILLALGFLAAHHTDPNLRMSESEKRDRWARVPAFAKRALYVLVAGFSVGALFGGRLGHFASWSLIAVSSVLFAEGVRRERPPLPRTKGGPLTEGESPSEYKQICKAAVQSFYISAGVSAVMALLAFL